jgi:hypothetical protein
MAWAGNAITLTANFDVNGGAATAALATQVKNTIVRVWNATFDAGYRVTTQVDVRVVSSLASDRSYIHIERNNSASHVDDFPSLYYADMTLNLPGANLEWTPAHEFGHMLGLSDHYNESLRSSMHDFCNGYSATQGFCGGLRSSDVEPGWEGNLMAVTGGVLQRKNLEELFTLHAMRLDLTGGSSSQEA